MTSQNWTFTPDDKGPFEWYRDLINSNLASLENQKIADQLNNAEHPTDEELSEMDDEIREVIEQQIDSRKSASDLAWEQTEYASSSYMNTVIMGSRSNTSTCNPTDTDLLINVLESFSEAPVFSSESIEFMECEVEYKF